MSAATRALRHAQRDTAEVRIRLHTGEMVDGTPFSTTMLSVWLHTSEGDRILRCARIASVSAVPLPEPAPCA